ncbi:MAG: sialate O-acetylesterase [Opitutaceae bacterium]|nr:sialate O-acetylesterase [Opitutaceae bacterium]
MPTLRLKLPALLLILLAPATLLAELSLPHFFSNNMVLQRDREVAIWGKANPGANITLNFKGRQVNAWANADGDWHASIESGPADATGVNLLISNGQERTTLENILVGEVWLASGQSNMVFSMNRVPAYAEIIPNSANPNIRMFNAPTVTAIEPQYDIDGEWTAASPATTPGYSAVAYFFARKLNAELDIPIGIIKTAWGGKPVETFTSRDALKTLPSTKKLVDAMLKNDSTFNPKSARKTFEKRLASWNIADAEWRAKLAKDRGTRPRKPSLAKRPLNTEGQPGVLFNSMIHPFAGYTIQGAIWYQGEANAKKGKIPYDLTLPLMIRDWRAHWNDPFYFNSVQLANFRKPSTEPGTQDYWAQLQDRQRLLLDTTPKTGMAVINDVGEADDIHPKDKKTVGNRLARWALAKTYGHKIVASGPLYLSSQTNGKSITVKFQYVGKGLESRDGKPLKRFEIAGADQVWEWANAKIITPDTVRVSSPKVKSPAAVRYAWASNPEGANLGNSEDLPASVFRSDNWDDVE